MQNRQITMIKKLTLALAAALALAGTAQAATLLDTGTPDGSGFAGTVDSSNFLALQFKATDAWRVDGIAAYLSGGQPGEHFALSLYQDTSSHLPGDLIASTSVSFNADGWNGAAALGWQLTSGNSYWLGVEGLAGSFIAPVGGLTMPGLTAFADGSHQGAYQAYAGIQFGVQLTGAVPEPAALGLLLLGLLGVAAATRHQRRSTR
jgi:hypothetical protein